MLSKLKKILKIILDRIKMKKEYNNDYKEYKKWNYNNPKVKTYCSYEAKILRQTHIIEKGLSLSNPRKGFGKKKISELIEMLNDYIKMKFPTNSVVFQNAINVLNEYAKFQKKLEYIDTDLELALKKLNIFISKKSSSGINYDTLENIEKKAKGDFKSFFLSRHSIRQFSEEKIDINLIKKAIDIAKKAPTACNRQACKAYLYNDKEINRKIGTLIAGNNGFDNEVKNYLVITADMSAFYDTFERNQIYIESGIFVLALVEALHYYGIASCILQNGEYKNKNKKFKEICSNIPPNEKITVFIAIGNYKKKFSYAVSRRKETSEILIIK